MNIMDAMNFRISKYLGLGVGIGICMLILVPSSVQASGCDFTRSLYVGVAPGQDIKCLQQYLNDQGHMVATHGVGAPGKETTMYADKTRSAVLAWQTKHNIPGANGVFGPASRSKYAELSTHSTTESASHNQFTQDSLEVQAQAARIDSDSEIGKVVANALEEVGDAHETLENSSSVSADAQSHLNKARSAILDMLFAAFNNENSLVLLKASVAINQATEAKNAVHIKSTSQATGDTRDEARRAINDAEDTITQLENQLTKAYEKLNRAHAEYDNADWDDAREDAQVVIAILRELNEKL